MIGLIMKNKDSMSRKQQVEEAFKRLARDKKLIQMYSKGLLERDELAWFGIVLSDPIDSNLTQTYEQVGAKYTEYENGYYEIQIPMDSRIEFPVTYPPDRMYYRPCKYNIEEYVSKDALGVGSVVVIKGSDYVGYISEVGVFSIKTIRIKGFSESEDLAMYDVVEVDIDDVIHVSPIVLIKASFNTGLGFKHPLMDEYLELTKQDFTLSFTDVEIQETITKT